MWIAFVLVHLAVAVLGFALPNQPMGDVTLVYEPWARQAVTGAAVVGITEPWIYPQWALLPMIVAYGLAWIGGYEAAWALLVTVANALAFALLLGRGRSTGRLAASSFWLVFTLFLGPIGMYRVDAMTVPLAVAGVLWLFGRPWVAGILLAFAAWIKVWPVGLLVAGVVAVRRRLAVVGGAAVVTATTLAIVLVAHGAAHLFGFVEGQTSRGLQLEAAVSAVYLWQATAEVEGSYVYYDHELLTFQVTGPEVDVVAAAMTPLLAVVVLALAALGAVKTWRGARPAALLPPLALSLVLALIVFNKVGSPQFMTWLIAPIVAGLVLSPLRWWRPAILALVIALLTFAVYPLAYHLLLAAHPGAVLLLTVRNAAVAMLLVWSVVRLARVPVRLPSPPR